MYIHRLIYALFATFFISFSHGDSPMNSSEIIVLEGKDSDGTQVYEGKVFPEFDAASQHYYYERWVLNKLNQTFVSHTTYDMDGTALVLQQSSSKVDGALLTYREKHLQKNYVGELVVNGDTALMRKITTKDVEQKKVTLRYPLVTGPTLFAHIEQNWQKLVELEQKLKVQFVLVENFSTMNFVIKLEKSTAKTRRFKMKPINPLMGFFVATIYIEFDSVTKQVLNYSGPVPQYQVDEHKKQRKVDALTRYTYL
jgi:hypothetical protein